MISTPPPSLWSTVSALPDYLLLSQTRQLARHEQALQILVLDHLREIEARQLHLTRGYGSLFDYVVRELGYTAAAAWRRIKAMRLSTQIGVAGELLRDGSLKLSNAAQLQNLFERSDRNERNHGRPPSSQGADGGAGGAPRGDVAGGAAPGAPMRAGERDLSPGGGPVLDAAAREKLVKQAVGKSTREVQQMLAEVDPELAPPSDRLRALGGGRWELKAAVDAECRHGLEKLQMLLSHQNPHLTLGSLVARLVREGLDRYDPERPRRARRSGSRGSATGQRSANTQARRDKDAVQRRVARAKSGADERRSEVEHNLASSGAVLANAPRLSAPKRPSEAERGSESPVAGAKSGAPTALPAGCRSEAEVVRASQAVAGEGEAASAPKQHMEAERCSAKAEAVQRSMARARGGTIERSEVARDDVSLTAVPEGGGRRREMEHACGPPKAMGGGGGRAASLPKWQRRAAGDGRSEGKGGVPGRAAGAAELRFDAGGHSASRAQAPGCHRRTTSVAKWLQYSAGNGRLGRAGRSPVLERHLAALRRVGAVPGEAAAGGDAHRQNTPHDADQVDAVPVVGNYRRRSRYVPAAVKRAVWRRDQGCCSYVDPHSGRRCGSRYRLEIDHIVPFALGGATEPGNLRIRCGAHHRFRHCFAPQPSPRVR